MRPMIWFPLALAACTPTVSIDDLSFQAVDLDVDHYDEGVAQFDLRWDQGDDCVRVDGLNAATFGGEAGAGEGGGTRYGDYLNPICVNTGDIVFGDMNGIDDEVLELVVPGDTGELVVRYGSAPFASRTLSWDQAPVAGESAVATWDYAGDIPTGDGQLQFFEGSGETVINLFERDGDFAFDGATLTLDVPANADLSRGVLGRDLFAVEVLACPARECGVQTEVELWFSPER